MNPNLWRLALLAKGYRTMATNVPLSTILTPLPLTVDQLADQIVRSVGEVTDVIDTRYADALLPTVPLLLQRRAYTAHIHPDLPELYARRDAIEIVQGAVRQLINTSGDDYSASLNQVFTNLNVLWQQTQQELLRLTSVGNVSRRPRVGRIGGVGGFSGPRGVGYGIPPWVQGTPHALNGMALLSGLPYQGSPYFGLGLTYGGAWLAGGGLIDTAWWSGVDAVVMPGLVMGSDAGY